MKKTIVILLAVAMMFTCLTGCGSKTSSDSSKPKLVIATSPDFPPFEELTGSGAVEGIEIDIMQKVCDELGMELVIEQVDFDSVLPGVQAGKYDVGVSGLTVTEERKQNSLFTDPYCLAAQAIVVPAGSSITSKADLAGKKVSVQTGTTAESFCMQNGYDVSSFTANNDAELACVTGKVDAWVIDDLTAAEMVKTYNAANSDQLVILNEAMTTEPYAFAFKLGQDELVGKINGVIKKMLDDGSIAAIFAKFDAPYTSPNA